MCVTAVLRVCVFIVCLVCIFMCVLSVYLHVCVECVSSHVWVCVFMWFDAPSCLSPINSGVVPALSMLLPVVSFRSHRLSAAVAVVMFRRRKKKRRLQISAPQDFQHRVHTSFDPASGRYVGLPPQWQSIIDTLRRPRPLVDPSRITEVELRKVRKQWHHHKEVWLVNKYEQQMISQVDLIFSDQDQDLFIDQFPIYKQWRTVNSSHLDISVLTVEVKLLFTGEFMFSVHVSKTVWTHDIFRPLSY